MKRLTFLLKHTPEWVVCSHLLSEPYFCKTDLQVIEYYILEMHIYKYDVNE